MSGKCDDQAVYSFKLQSYASVVYQDMLSPTCPTENDKYQLCSLVVRNNQSHRRRKFDNGTRHGHAVLCICLYILALHCKRMCVVVNPHDFTLLALSTMSTRKGGKVDRELQGCWSIVISDLAPFTTWFVA